MESSLNQKRHGNFQQLSDPYLAGPFSREWGNESPIYQRKGWFPHSLLRASQLLPFGNSVLRWRPFPFVRRLIGHRIFSPELCCSGDPGRNSRRFFLRFLIDDLISQKSRGFQSNMGRTYASSEIILKGVKDKDNCWEFPKVERCHSNNTFLNISWGGTKTCWTFWKFNENLLKCYAGRRPSYICCLSCVMSV